MASKRSEQWLAERLVWIKGLKNPSEQQQLLALLAEKNQRTAEDEKKFKLLLQAEKAAQHALEIRAKATAFLNAEKKAQAKADRKARDHALYQVAGLLIVAGLVDSKTGQPKVDPAALVGALSSLGDLPKDHPKWTEWYQIGSTLLKQQALTS